MHTEHKGYFKASSMLIGKFISCDFATRKPNISRCTATSIVFPVEDVTLDFFPLNSFYAVKEKHFPLRFITDIC